MSLPIMSNRGGRGGCRKRAPTVDPTSEEYIEKRRRNNEAVHRTREKRRQEEIRTGEKVNDLREENTQLERRVEALNKELSFLKEMFVSFASGGADTSTANEDVASTSTNTNDQPSSSKSKALTVLRRQKKPETKFIARKHKKKCVQTEDMSILPEEVKLFSELILNLASGIPDIRKAVVDLKSHVLEKTEGRDNDVQGISLLDVKNVQMLDYIINLVYLMLSSVDGQSLEGNESIDRLIELRTVLERIRPIESKMQYQIEKLLKTAVATTTNKDDTLQYKPRLDVLRSVLQDEDESGNESGDEEKSAKSSGVYVPPKVMAMHYEEEPDSDVRAEERTRRRVLNSSLVRELQQQYSKAPEEVRDWSTQKSRAREEQTHRDEYEEEYMVRLQMTKKQKQSAKKSAATERLESLLEFGDYGAMSGIKQPRKEIKTKSKAFKKAKSKKRK